MNGALATLVPPLQRTARQHQQRVAGHLAIASEKEKPARQSHHTRYTIHSCLRKRGARKRHFSLKNRRKNGQQKTHTAGGCDEVQQMIEQIKKGHGSRHSARNGLADNNFIIQLKYGSLGIRH